MISKIHKRLFLVPRLTKIPGCFKQQCYSDSTIRLACSAAGRARIPRHPVHYLQLSDMCRWMF